MDAQLCKVPPLRSTGNPGKGWLSLAPDIALITFLSHFRRLRYKLLEKDFVDEMKDEL